MPSFPLPVPRSAARAVFAALVGLALAVAGCDLTSQTSVCTAEFAMVTVRVVQTDEAPVSGLDLTVYKVETDRVLSASRIYKSSPDSLGQLEMRPGIYVVASDGVRDQLDPNGTVLRGQWTGPDVQVTETFEVARGECHVQKLSGPDTLRVCPDCPSLSPASVPTGS